MKTKTFKWNKESDVISLEDYIDELENNGWVLSGSVTLRTNIDGEPIYVILSCVSQNYNQ